MTAIYDTLARKNISYRPDIDGLRGMAVAMVLLFHAFPQTFPFGFIGVDIFFVISGYLISKIIFYDLDSGNFSFRIFYAKRIKRIIPSLILVLLFTVPMGYLTLLAIDFKQLGKEIAGGAFFISNFVLLSDSGYFDAESYLKPLLHLWSLAIEEQFYLVWPLLLWTLYKFKFSKRYIFYTLVALLFLSFWINISQIFNPIATFYIPITRFWEFLIGSMLAFLEKENLYTKFRNYLLPIIGIISLVLSLSISEKDYYPGYFALLPTLGAAGIIGSSWNQSLANNKLFFSLFSFRPIVLIGQMSFPLYLWHWPIFSFARIINNEALTLKICVLLILLTVFMAYCTHFLVENPIRKSEIKSSVIAYISIFLICIGILGLIIYFGNGFPNRKVNLDNIEINNAINYDAKEGFRNGTCFLDALNEETSRFNSICMTGLNRNLPTIVLWGDSHAASLYRGLVKLEHSHFNIIQLTSSGCPPIVGMEIAKRPKCKDINQYVINKIIEIKPKFLVVSAFWSMYTGEPSDGWERLNFDLFKNTINTLNSSGITNIVLVGQLPIYTSRQADLLRFQFDLNVDNSVGSRRTFKNFDYKAYKYDALMRRFAEEKDLIFISPLDALCNASGCEITTSDEKVTPLSFDYGHLTEIGSAYVVKKLSLSDYLH